MDIEISLTDWTLTVCPGDHAQRNQHLVPMTSSPRNLRCYVAKIVQDDYGDTFPPNLDGDSSGQADIDANSFRSSNRGHSLLTRCLHLEPLAFGERGLTGPHA